MSRARTRRSPAGATTLTTASHALDRVRNAVGSRPWWYTTFLVIGFVTLLTAVGVLFFGINDTPRDITTSAPAAPVQSLDFAISLSRLVGAPLDQGGTIKVLNNGDEFLPALLQAIDGAKASINFSVYIWED